MKRFIINLFILMISIALMIGFLELLAEFLNPVFTSKITYGYVGLGIAGKDIVEYPSGYMYDRELFWKLDSSFEEYNSLGFRDKEFSPTKDKDIFRIICMGDSVTFGWPSKIENTYPKILENLLNLKFPEKKFEVFNAGVPGYTSYQGLIWLKKDIIKYSPDLIIVYYGINDRAASNKPDKDQKLLPLSLVKISNYLKRFQFYKLMRRVILHFEYPPGEEDLYLAHRVSQEDYKDNLDSMMKIARNNGIKTLFIVNPVFYDPEKKIVLNDTRYISSENIFKLDISNLFKKREEECDEFFLDDIRPFNFHLTDKGQKILAKEIFETLVNSDFIE